ncbi:hypothetical protein BJP36_25280 [Moorena producens JHB]|uniref:Sigma-70 family RNA polymerase sigma factor n=1 Tax=Moorena producens (strain JHB) TaxID=1454205 RepID=A0A1D9G5N7_MOOP1|nr:hypothetical protein [Moorena producens]AOY82730.2 hypothetical protein BJP36_25280 [Moorena producens JHB]
MSKQIQHLVIKSKQNTIENQQQYQVLAELVEQILRTRKVCRPRPGHPLSGIYLEIYQTVQEQLNHQLEEDIDSPYLQMTSEKEWGCWRDSVFKKVLDEGRLQQLALEAQRHQPHTPERFYALTELLNALKLSGKLCYRGKFSPSVYDDAVNRTLYYVYQNLNHYNQAKGKFIAWVNYRLDKMLQKAQQDLTDPFIQAQSGKIVRIKYQLSALIKGTKLDHVIVWITLTIKGLITDKTQVSKVTKILMVLFLLSQLIAKDRTTGDSLVFEMAKASLPLSANLSELTGESLTIETVAQPETELTLYDQVRHYFKKDPEKLLHKHIKKHPQATLQVIGLAYLDGKKWQEISDSLGIKISSLNNFFQRNIRKLAPEIKRYIEEEMG